jgi:hypothetical protein
MKKLILLSSFIVLAIGMCAQAPDYFNYQAMLRSPNGVPMANKNITLVVDLIRDHIDGPSIYLESHEVQTNEMGMVSLKIGDTDFFDEIDWKQGPYFMSITVDGIHMGTSQLLSVPYALYAKNAGNIEDDDPDPSNELQILSVDDHELSISGGNTVTLPNVLTPWQYIETDIYYVRNVGIGMVAKPEFPLDIKKNVYGDHDMALIRLRNVDEGPQAYVGIALEAYGDLENRIFNRSELLLTSDEYDEIPDLNAMTAIRAAGNGFSVIADSQNGSIRFYTTSAQDSITERVRINPEGNMGLGTDNPEALIHINNGDAYIEDPNRGLILTSPGGKNFRIKVRDDGTLFTEQVFL